MDIDSAVKVLKNELVSNPVKLEEEKTVIEKYGRIFKYDNIDNITAEQFQSFLDTKENKHWTLSRVKTVVTRDMPKLRRALKILLDESIPIEKRLQRLRDRNSSDFQENLGKAVMTPILLVTNPTMYPILNGTVERAFKQLGTELGNESDPLWERYPQVQKIILNLASKYGLSLWQIDWVWWKVLSSITFQGLIEYLNKTRMNENYKPVVIMTLVENDGRATKEMIEQQLRSYNLTSTSKSMVNTAVSVLTDNHIIRKEEDEYVLNLPSPPVGEHADTILALCNQKIDEFKKGQTKERYWKIAPGPKASMWEEQRANKVTAIGWNSLGDLSNRGFDDIREDLKRQYPDSYQSLIAQFEDFLSIKKGDIVIANNGYSKIVGIGKVIGDYRYRPDLTFRHTYPVEWFDTKDREISPQTGLWRKTVSPVSPELYHEIVSDQSTNCLLLRHNPEFKRNKLEREYWNDLLGKEYQYGKTIPNFKKLAPGTKTVWFYTDNDDLYFWGHGDVSTVRELLDGKYVAGFEAFSFFGNGTPVKADALTQDAIKSLDGWNPYNSIIEINTGIYDEIIANAGEAISGKVSEPAIETFDDEKLPKLSREDLDVGYQKISESLLISKEKVTEIVMALASGRHVLLAGPIGTGKTHLARIISEIVWDKVGGYFAEDHTATADWSTHDVIGGIVPKMEEGNVVYEIQYGCVVDTVRRNWQHGIEGGNRMGFRLAARKPYRGVWLVIDEFNRADIDKAFGQLFTALRTRRLKIPTDRLGESYRNLKIPEDYRIIGTINTADKHFLFRLSDALKSRFAYIEIDIPSRHDYETEIYYAMKNALNEVELDNASTLVILNDNEKRIDPGNSSPELYTIAHQAYNFLDSVRVFKKLGTAILQLIYQNMLVATQLTGNAKIALDNALTSVLVPQLEGLSHADIGTLSALHDDRIIQFFKSVYRSPDRQSYYKSFAKTIEYLGTANHKQLAANFTAGSLKSEDENTWKPLQTAYDNKKKDLEFGLVRLKQAMDEFERSAVV